MPTNKDFKRLVRRRMQKTGESYVAARSQLLKSRPSRVSSPSVEAPSPRALSAKEASALVAPRSSAPDYAKLAGMSDAALKAKTGCTWERWVKALDHAGARGWPHREIADYVHERFKIPGWWAQTVTVGYERIRGLREIGQRRSGAYEATKSRTFAVPVATLYDAFAVARARARWLPRAGLSVRKATLHKSVRITWGDGSSVEVWLIAKGADKSTVQVQHRKLSDKDAAVRMKAYWAARLDALGKLLKA